MKIKGRRETQNQNRKSKQRKKNKTFNPFSNNLESVVSVWVRSVLLFCDIIAFFYGFCILIHFSLHISWNSCARKAENIAITLHFVCFDILNYRDVYTYGFCSSYIFYFKLCVCVWLVFHASSRCINNICVLFCTHVLLFYEMLKFGSSISIYHMHIKVTLSLSAVSSCINKYIDHVK